MTPEYHIFRPKRPWCPEWLWRIVRPVVRWEPFLTLFTEPPDEQDWGEVMTPTDPLRAPHPGEPHDFDNTCRKCGERGTLFVAIITPSETVHIDPMPVVNVVHQDTPPTTTGDPLADDPNFPDKALTEKIDAEFR